MVSDLTPLRTVCGQREMLDVLSTPNARGLVRVRHVTDVRTGVHRLREWTPEEIQHFEHDVEAGLR